MFCFLDEELDELLWDVNRTEASHYRLQITRILSVIIGKFSDHIKKSVSCQGKSLCAGIGTQAEYFAHINYFYSISFSNKSFSSNTQSSQA